MRSLTWVLLATLVLVACGRPPEEGSLRVRVALAPGLAAGWAQVEVSGGGLALESAPVELAGKTELLVGVVRGELPGTVRVIARGYSAADCAPGSATGEESVERQASFASPTAEVLLELAPRPSDGGATGGGAGGGGGTTGGGGGTTGGGGGGTDADGDGSPASVDCDDQDPLVKPGAVELCSDGKDNDCAAGADCADPACAGEGCVGLGRCMAGVCVAPSEANLCADGVDNDSDLLVDCADPDCPAGAACSDTDACTLSDTCGGPDAGCVPGSAKVCAAPPAPWCFAPAGVCLPDAGGACSYAVVPGSCDDGLACTTQDTCDADGGCAGSPRACDAPPAAQCWQPTGTCSEAAGGQCRYTALAPATRCDDGDACTDGDACDGDGGCLVGARRACAPPGECWQHDGTCFADGGCGFSARDKQPCGDGGFCNAAGTCRPRVFPWPPSNFSEADLPPSAGALQFGCGVTTLNTGLADGGVSWTNNCPGNATPEYAIVPVGNVSALVLFADSLGVDAGSTLRAIGRRPLIIAVRDDATVHGSIDVGSDDINRGAGGNFDCVGGAGDAGAASGSPETAGGGGGAAFGANGGDGSNGANGGPRGTRGFAFGNDTLVPLRAGCRGGNGGRVGNPWGVGGNGGGAVQLSVAGALRVGAAGTVTAYGAGGRGGQADQRTGGGGAGSGGGVLLEGTTITVEAGGAVTANGGSGGEGSGYGTGWNGQDGVDGAARSTSQVLTPTVGACGGNGGAGGARYVGAGSAGAPECGTNMPGGGGGGGVGRIRFNASTACTLTGAVISPAPTGNRTGCF